MGLPCRFKIKGTERCDDRKDYNECDKLHGNMLCIDYSEGVTCEIIPTLTILLPVWPARPRKWGHLARLEAVWLSRKPLMGEDLGSARMVF